MQLELTLMQLELLTLQLELARNGWQMLPLELTRNERQVLPSLVMEGRCCSYATRAHS